MPVYGSADVGYLLFDGYSILGFVTDLTVGEEAVTEETTPLGAAWETTAPTGEFIATLEQNGFYDDAANSVNALLAGQEGVTRVVSLALTGNVVGGSVWNAEGAIEGAYTRVATHKELHKANGTWKITGAVSTGKLLAPLTSRGVAGNTQTTPVDNGASSSNGGSGILQVSALSLGGYTNLQVKIRHSVDNITYADLVTFAVVTAAPGGQRIAVAGTVNRYLATSWSYGGAGAAPSTTFSAGFSRG